jgi:2-hydroxychromene-2-carboxylate isomerase
MFFVATGVQTQRYHAHDVERLAIPVYTGNAAQRDVAAAARKAAAAAAAGDAEGLTRAEELLDSKVGALWGWDQKTLERAREVLKEFGRDAGVNNEDVVDGDEEEAGE